MRLLILCVFILLVVSCSDRSTDPTLQDSTLMFYGRYFAADDSANIAQQKVDSVELYIVNGRSYTMTFYNAGGGASDFCDHSGSLSGMYTRFVTFTPSYIYESNCDSNRIPNGEFTADYATHGDTIYITYSRGDTLKRLKLVE